MTAEDRAEFLAERKTGVGGSDCASLFNEGYGCRRRLWYDKSGYPPNYPKDNSDLMELGNVLEPFFRDKYARQTGREVLTPDHKFGTFRHPDIPALLVHVDGIISDNVKDWRPGNRVGVLEVKSVGNRVWWDVKHSGLPVDYILQMQHAFAASNAMWGAYAIGNRDNGKMLTWDVERDSKLCGYIISAVESFWPTVGDEDQIPAKLEGPEDFRCQRCDWRFTCRGEEFYQIEHSPKSTLPEDDSLRPLRQTYLERKALEDEVEALVEEAKAELTAALGDREAVLVAGKPIYYRPQQRETINVKALAAAYDDLLAKLKKLDPQAEAEPPSGFFKEKGKVFRPLRVY